MAKFRRKAVTRSIAFDSCLSSAVAEVLHWPKTTLLVAALSVLTVLWPLNKVGGEFLPQINEGDLLYMPSTLPGISAAEAASMLQKPTS
ncbi:cation efflux system protein [Escherichia coli]|uniref:Cation efflux system protein n=1 Tax=Escherichia coli TaxID=562 RepID=A0A376P264_ECOLX|nr:cation efflux system protein [Escherichia coli]